MSCKCFDREAPDSSMSFEDRLSACKCKCSSRLTVTENKRTFTIKTNSSIYKVDKIKIDAFLFNTCEFKKCDYLFTHTDRNNKDTYIFVELKGRNITTAIEQLENTINIFYNYNYLTNKRVRGAIAFSTFPKDNGTYRKEKRRIENKMKNKIKDFYIEQKSHKISYNVTDDKFT